MHSVIRAVFLWGQIPKVAARIPAHPATASRGRGDILAYLSLVGFFLAVKKA